VWNGGTLPPGFPAGGAVAGSPDEFLCGFKITAVAATEENILMGGFWSNIANMSDKGGKRSSIDQARMQMVQQYLAAVLNVHMFGSGSPGMLSTARAAYCSADESTIKGQVGVLGSFNQSGDNQNFDPGQSATSQLSKDYADIDAWDIPQFPGLSDEDAGANPTLALNKTINNGVTGTALPTDFTLHAACSTGGCGSASLVGNPNAAATAEPSGIYNLTDVGVSQGGRNAGTYTKSTWTCTGTGNFFLINGSAGTGTGTLAVGKGGVVSCNITNTHP
jgi:hypothetical protein